MSFQHLLSHWQPQHTLGATFVLHYRVAEIPFMGSDVVIAND